jgi:hypothetical protein
MASAHDRASVLSVYIVLARANGVPLSGVWSAKPTVKRKKARTSKPQNLTKSNPPSHSNALPNETCGVHCTCGAKYPLQHIPEFLSTEQPPSPP